MKLQTPIRTVLILVAALLVSGCALKPKATSRFHSPVNGSACNCFTCQNAPTAAAQHAAMTSPCTSCDSYQAGETVIESQAPRPLYSATPLTPPTQESNRVESFNANAPLEQEQDDDFPIVEEITPAFGSGNSSGSSTRSSAEQPKYGGSFKGMDTSEAIVVAPSEPEPVIEPMIAAPVDELEAAEEGGFGVLDMEPMAKDTAPSIADAVAEAAEETPAATFDMKEAIDKVTESVTTAPAEIPASTEAVVPQLPTPIEKIEVPKPANKFKPGQPFKPRKRTSASDSTWNDLDTNFYQHGADEGIAADSELASFFAAKEDVVAKRVPNSRRIGEGRVVLRADKVERSVIYTPPAKNASQAVVPPLSRSFRTEHESGNWLRHGDHAIAALPAQDTHRVYEVTESKRIANNSMAAEPAADPIFETLRQQKAVRLKAIPLARSVTRQAMLPVAPANVNTPAMAPVTVEENAEEAVRVASPPQRKPSRPYTARSTDDDGVVTPPWRMK